MSASSTAWPSLTRHLFLIKDILLCVIDHTLINRVSSNVVFNSTRLASLIFSRRPIRKECWINATEDI